MNNAENSISEPVGFQIFWGSMPPTPQKVRALGAHKTCLVCHGWQLFPTEFGKLCVPLKKSWLRPCLAPPLAD